MQTAHIASSKDISNQAVGLMHRERVAMHRGNAGSILSAMLQEQQGIIEKLIYWGMGNCSNDAAHRPKSLFLLKV